MRAQNENACPMSTRAISHSVKAEKNQERSPIYNSGILQEARVIKIFMAMVGLFGVFFFSFSRDDMSREWLLNRSWFSFFAAAAAACEFYIDPMHKWLPIKNSFVSIKISPTNLVFELIIQKNFHSQTRLAGLI